MDAIPSFLLKKVLDAVGPYLLNIINRCLETSMVPEALKHAIVRPLLKKPNLDVHVVANFRPVSNLPFISKILEKVVLKQLLRFLDQNKVFELFQSGFKKYHSTETALLKVLSDVLLAADSGVSTVLILLDLSAAFDTISHYILRLASLRVMGTCLSWFRSSFWSHSVFTTQKLQI